MPKTLGNGFDLSLCRERNKTFSFESSVDLVFPFLPRFCWASRKKPSAATQTMASLVNYLMKMPLRKGRRLLVRLRPSRNESSIALVHIVCSEPWEDRRKAALFRLLAILFRVFKSDESVLWERFIGNECDRQKSRGKSFQSCGMHDSCVLMFEKSLIIRRYDPSRAYCWMCHLFHINHIDLVCHGLDTEQLDRLLPSDQCQLLLVWIMIDHGFELHNEAG